MEYGIGTKVFGDWEIVGELGEGSYGKVYELKKTGYGVTAKAAMKLLRIPKNRSEIKETFGNTMDEASVTRYYESVMERLVREIEIMYEVKDDPNVVRCEDHHIEPRKDTIGWDVLIRMELLTPLLKYLENHPLDEKTVIRLGSNICSALVSCQNKGLLHRDIKPSNIFVDASGRFKLGDFGVACVTKLGGTMTARMGTENFMSPEVFHGGLYDEKADIYSLGIVLYRFMNNDRLPFYPPYPEQIYPDDQTKAFMSRMRGETPAPPCNASKAFADVILKACAPDPKDRYATASEMLSALQALTGGVGPAGFPVITQQPVSKKLKIAETAFFETKATGSDLSYQWQHRAPKSQRWETSDDRGSTTCKLTVRGTRDRNHYQYRCAITDASGHTVYTTPARLTVEEKKNALPLILGIAAGILVIFLFFFLAPGDHTDTPDPGTSTTAPSHTSFSIQKQPVDQTVLGGTQAVFSVEAAGDAVTYQWQWWSGEKDGWKNATSSGNQTAVLTVDATAERNGLKYRCQITDQNKNMLYTKEVMLTIVSITEQPKNQSVQEGDSAVFSVKASGSGLRYQWQWWSGEKAGWKNATSSGSTSATLKVEATNVRNGLKYRCQITLESGSVLYSNEATLTVAPSKITQQPKSQSVQEGDSAVFSVKASGSGLRYQWQWWSGQKEGWKNASSSGNTSATLKVEGTNTHNGLKYRCEITTKSGDKLYSNEVTLTVAPSKITQQPKSQTIQKGGTAVFSVKASGSGLRYQWQWWSGQKEGWKNASSSGNTSATLKVEGTSDHNGLKYRCEITTKSGTKLYSETVTLTVK